jgi:hypothetical protein
MLKFLVKTPSASEGGERSPGAKRQKIAEDGERPEASAGSDESGGGEPCSFFSWNANSLANRCGAGPARRAAGAHVRGLDAGRARPAAGRCKEGESIEELRALIREHNPDVRPATPRPRAGAPRGAPQHRLIFP